MSARYAEGLPAPPSLCVLLCCTQVTNQGLCFMDAEGSWSVSVCLCGTHSAPCRRHSNQLQVTLQSHRNKDRSMKWNRGPGHKLEAAAIWCLTKTPKIYIGEKKPTYSINASGETGCPREEEWSYGSVPQLVQNQFQNGPNTLRLETLEVPEEKTSKYRHRQDIPEKEPRKGNKNRDWSMELYEIEKPKTQLLSRDSRREKSCWSDPGLISRLYK